MYILYSFSNKKVRFSGFANLPDRSHNSEEEEGKCNLGSDDKGRLRREKVKLQKLKSKKTKNISTSSTMKTWPAPSPSWTWWLCVRTWNGVKWEIFTLTSLFNFLWCNLSKMLVNFLQREQKNC